MKNGFDFKKYLLEQSNKILERMKKFDNKLYLEFGGKLFDDFHASRVLPGFAPDTKLKMLLKIKDRVEILVVINSEDIMTNKVRKDLNITYDAEAIRLIEAFYNAGLYVGSVVVTRYVPQPEIDRFITKLHNQGIKVYKNYFIPSYPHEINTILSDDGFGKNEYVETTKPVVVVTAPGPGSGKMAVCLSQLYHEMKHGVKAGYAKFETFPVWNLPLDHPLNLAYEAATVDLHDINMIDTFHLEKYGVIATNYNRDIASFPVLKAIFERIYGTSPYFSPTDMGVNMIKPSITNDKVVCEASKQEIIRRLLNAKIDLRDGLISQDDIEKYNAIAAKAGATIEQRKVVFAARAKEAKTGVPCAAIQLPNGKIVTGKTSDLFSPCSSVIINALKVISKIDDKLELIPHNFLEPIQELKVKKMGNRNARLHADESLIALAISATSNPLAKLAMENLDKLKGCELHSTTILNPVDMVVYKKLNINVTADPFFQARRLYHK